MRPTTRIVHLIAAAVLLCWAMASCSDNSTRPSPFAEYETSPVRVDGLWYSQMHRLISLGVSDGAIWSIDPATEQEEHLHDGRAVLGSLSGDQLLLEDVAPLNYRSSYVLLDATGHMVGEVHGEDLPWEHAYPASMTDEKILFVSGSSIWSYEVHSGSLEQLVSTTWPPDLLSDPALAPDGSCFVYKLYHSDLENYRSALWVFDLETQKAKRLTEEDGNVGFPKWSPDGTHIGFSAWTGSSWQIHVIDAGGGDARQISDGEWVLWHHWSPSGHRIACFDQGPIIRIYDLSGELAAEIDPGDLRIGFWSQQLCWLNDDEIAYPSYDRPGQLVIHDLAAGESRLVGSSKEILLYPEDPSTTHLGIEFHFTTDRETYSVGDPVVFKFDVRNDGPYSVGFAFSSLPVLRLEAYCSGDSTYYPCILLPEKTMLTVRPGEDHSLAETWRLTNCVGESLPAGECVVVASLDNGHSPRLRRTIRLTESF